MLLHREGSYFSAGGPSHWYTWGEKKEKPQGGGKGRGNGWILGRFLHGPRDKRSTRGVLSMKGGWKNGKCAQTNIIAEARERRGLALVSKTPSKSEQKMESS